jgi:PadR family transcriptional regulator, regulatory protein PadR
MEPLSRITPATIDVLSVLDEATGPTWGLAVIKSSGRPAGSVYPILDRLEQTGWVTSKWEDDPTRSGPRRRFYELTEAGSTAARQAIVAFRSRAVRATGAPATGAARS